MTKLKRLMVTVAAAAGLLALVTAPASAAPQDTKDGVSVSSLGGSLKLIKANLSGNQRSARVAGPQQDAFLISNVLSNRCWDAELSSIGHNGTNMLLWDCDNTKANQAFYITQIPEGYLRFQNVQSGRYLDASMSSIGGNGTKIQLWDFVAGGKNQWWYGTVIPEGWVRIQTPASPRYLTAEGTVGGNGTRLQLWDFIAGGKNQWWCC